MKAVILTRVSSREQEDGKSLDAQKENLIRYCQRNNLEILKTYVIVESSTRGEREDFYAMLDFCKKQKEPIAVLVDAVDRLQRSFKETPLLEELRISGKIELHFVRENLKITKDTRPSEIMIWNIHVMLAQSYVLQLSENVKRSFNYKKEKGEWFGAAPVGYVNYKNEQNKSDIKPDETRAPLIIKLFERFAQGDISCLQLQKYAETIGLRSKKNQKISKNHIVRIIDNRFYYGEMLIKGVVYPHIYKPLIRRDLWERCQILRNGGKSKMPTKTKHDYLFRGLITCKQSGKTVGIDHKKNRYGDEYNYLIYFDKTGKKRFYISEAEVENEVLAVLKSVHIPDKDFEEAKKRVLTTLEGEKDFYSTSIKDLQKRGAEVDKKLNKLLDLLINDTIAEADYAVKNEQLKQEQREINEEIERHQNGNHEFRSGLTFFLTCSNKFYDEFVKSSNIELKRQILKIMIRTFYIDGGKVEISLRPPFNWMQKNAENGAFYKWRE